MDAVKNAHGVAIIGARTFLGTHLLSALEEDRQAADVLAIDVAPPAFRGDKTVFLRVDLTSPGAKDALSEAFQRHNVQRVFHGAFLSDPHHADQWAKAVQELGTERILNACAVADVSQLVLSSSTLVYGACPGHPSMLTEDTALQRSADSEFISSRVQAELLAQRFADAHKDTRVSILRFAPIVGPTIKNFFTQFFARPVAPVLMGYDPLIQLLHERDAVRAARKVLASPLARGAYNIVGDGVMRYTTALAYMGKLRWPVPHFVAKPLSRALWASQLSGAPPAFVDFLRYMCVADGSRARTELGFTPGWTVQSTLRDFLGLRDDFDARERYG